MNRVFKQILVSWAAALALACESGVQAAEQFQALSVPYKSNSSVTLGSSLDVDLIDQQRDSCLKFGDDDLKWLDSDGAVSTVATVELVTDYQSLAKSLGLEVDYKSKTSVSIELLKAGGNIDVNVKYDDFAKNETNSLAIIVKASSDFGRKGLRSYPLQDDFKTLLSEQKYEEFRQRCGTHTIVAERRDAMVAVVITISEVTVTSKRAIEQMYRTQLNAQGSVKVATIQGSSDFTQKWKSLVESASRLGKMTIRFESRGGAGISDALRQTISGNPQDVVPILAALSTVGASFTREKSAPVEYLLLSNTAFGANVKVVAPDKLEKLNSYYLQLSRLDYARKRIGGYRNDMPNVFDKYYSKTLLALEGERRQLVTAIEACVLNDHCQYQIPKELGLMYAEDIILPESVTLECSYKRFDSKDGKVKLNVLTNAAVVLRGKARLTEYVALPVALLTRLGPETPGATQTMTSGFQAFSMAAPAADGTARFISQIDNRIFRPDLTVSAGTVIIQNEAMMMEQLQQLLGSIYAIGMQTKYGLAVQNTVGPPFGGNCPLKAIVL